MHLWLRLRRSVKCLSQCLIDFKRRSWVALGDEQQEVTVESILSLSKYFGNYILYKCIVILTCSPPARWGSLASLRVTSFLPSLISSLPPSFPNSELQIAVGTAGPQLQTPNHSKHCRTSTANSRSQWALPCKLQSVVGSAGLQPRAPHFRALPDLNRERQISVDTAGPQVRVPDLSGHCPTSTASSRSQRASSASSHSQESLQISVGTARWDLALAVEVWQCPCQSHQREWQNKCQSKCQNRCQIECQNRILNRVPE